MRIRTVEITEQILEQEREAQQRLCAPQSRNEGEPSEVDYAAKRLSVAKRIFDFALGRKYKTFTEETALHELYKSKGLVREPKKLPEAPPDVLKRLEKTTGWLEDDTPEKLVRKLRPAQLANLLSSHEDLKDLDEEELAAHIINGVKVEVATKFIYVGEPWAMLQVGKFYPENQSVIRDRGLGFAVSFLQGRDNFTTRLQYGINSPDQIIVTWQPSE